MAKEGISWKSERVGIKWDLWEIKPSLALQRNLKEIVFFFPPIYMEKASEEIGKQGWAKIKNTPDRKMYLNTFSLQKGIWLNIKMKIDW